MDLNIEEHYKAPIKLEFDIPKFVNTAEFSPAARTFIHLGHYCDAPIGTIDYNEFWDEEERRVKNGYTVGGITITGDHYYYLNYCPIKATDKNDIVKRKRLMFPRFLDMDYYWFREFQKAKEAGEGMITAKARRKGFSYKSAAINAKEFQFERGAMCIVGAFEGTFAQSTMDMILEMLSFQNEHTAWSKRRLIDRKDHIKSGFKVNEEGFMVEKGYKSEILTVTFKDNPSAAIGKTANMFNFEEGGKWPGLESAYKLTQPTWMDGDIAVGIPLIWGTGGDMEKGSVDFDKMFYNPRAYGLRAFENIWDEGAIHDPKGCGYFVPATQYHEPYVDDDGNSDIKKATDKILNERAFLRASGSKESYEKHLTQHPLTPQEAFLRTTGNIFPAADLLEHQLFLQTNRGRMEYVNGEARFVPDVSCFEAHYPFDPENKEGCVVIYEAPYRSTQTGEIPHHLYVGGTDPYTHDNAKYTDSLAATYIYKRFVSPSQTYDQLVASYVGRPQRSEMYYDTVIKLLEYYNAVCLYENQFKDMKNHFQQRGKLHLLKRSPENTIRSLIKDPTGTREFGINMSEPIKRFGETIIRDWLLKETGETDERGFKLCNLHKIPDINLVKELIAYDQKKNSDRTMAFMMVMLQNNEDYRITVDENKTSQRDNSLKSFHKRFYR
jgi:hypothetical protein